MALKVSQADEHIRIHDGAADFRRFAEFAVENGNFHIVCAAQTIADDNLATRGHGPEAVKVGAVHMLQRVLAAAGIERVAIRQEGQAALLLTEIRNHLCVIGAQEGQIAQLAKVHLDGDKLALQIHILDARRNAQLAKLIRQTRADRTAEIREINRCFFHVASPFILFLFRVQTPFFNISQFKKHAISLM